MNMFGGSVACFGGIAAPVSEIAMSAIIVAPAADAPTRRALLLG